MSKVLAAIPLVVLIVVAVKYFFFPAEVTVWCTDVNDGETVCTFNSEGRLPVHDCRTITVVRKKDGSRSAPREICAWVANVNSVDVDFGAAYADCVADECRVDVPGKTRKFPWRETKP